MDCKFASSTSFFNRKRDQQATMDNNQIHKPFEHICTAEDMKNLMARKQSLPKCPSWNSFAIPDFQSRSGTATPDGTPQNSPKMNRKLVDPYSTNNYNNFKKPQQQASTTESKSSYGWLNTGLFPSFNHAGDKQQQQQPQKSRSYRNISNFDINAVSPISF